MNLMIFCCINLYPMKNVDGYWLSQSVTLNRMMEDLGLERDTIPLYDIDADTLDALVACPEGRNDVRALLASLDIEALSKFIEACNYLDIPELFTMGVQAYAERYTTDEALEYFQHHPEEYLSYCRRFAEEINHAIGRAIISWWCMERWILEHKDITSQRAVVPVDNLRSMGLSPDGALVVLVSNESIVKLWDLARNVLIRTLNNYGDKILSVNFSPDGTMIIAGLNNKTVKLWDVQDGHSIKTFGGHNGWVNSVCFSSDGKVVASVSEKTIRLWDVENGVCIKTMNGCTEFVSSACMCTARNIVAFGSGFGQVGLWDIKNAGNIQTLGAHEDWVNAVLFSPDGSMVVSTSHDGRVNLWDVESGECVASRVIPERDIKSVVFSPDGKQLRFITINGTLWSWNIDVPVLSFEQALLLMVMKRRDDSASNLFDCLTNKKLQEIYQSLPDALKNGLKYLQKNRGFYDTCSMQ